MIRRFFCNQRDGNSLSLLLHPALLHPTADKFQPFFKRAASKVARKFPAIPNNFSGSIQTPGWLAK
jgi:hypothetical protein